MEYKYDDWLLLVIERRFKKKKRSNEKEYYYEVLKIRAITSIITRAR